jgi:hypothetical protein
MNFPAPRGDRDKLSCSGRRILVVEDEMIVCMMIEQQPDSDADRDNRRERRSGHWPD